MIRLINGNVLVIYGACDEFVDPTYVSRLVKNLPVLFFSKLSLRSLGLGPCR